VQLWQRLADQPPDDGEDETEVKGGGFVVAGCRGIEIAALIMFREEETNEG
jgi:hypothetical protein